MFKAVLALVFSAKAFDRKTFSHYADSSEGDVGPFVNETWHSGVLPIDSIRMTAANDTPSDMFYWWFESRSDPSKDPIVLWLTGGPGCASEIALFYENGPYKFNPDGKTLHGNPNSWNNKANIVYIDQPIPTGYSKAAVKDVVINEKGVAEDMGSFFIHFLEKYPQLQGRDFYITGESYAGHYIPAIMHHFMFDIKDKLKATPKGMAIGNGLVSPLYQYPAYAVFAKENKLIGEGEYLALDAALKVCQGLIESGVWPIAMEECQIAVEIILGNPIKPKFNVYDIREKCNKPPLCYDFSPADTMLLKTEIMKVLGVPTDGQSRDWQECNMAVHIAMTADWMLDLSGKVVDILNSGLQTLVYSGDKDFICNWRGGEAWTLETKWNSQTAFQAADYTDWMVDGKAAGALRQEKNFKFLRVFDAGHMVPMNQPVAALQMLNEFIGQAPATEEKVELIQ